MTGRLLRYTAAVYPLAVQLPLVLAWTFGLTLLFAALDDRVHRWTLDPWVLVSAFTLLVAMLLMRMMDDIRDADYDRVHYPARPLPAGVVRVPDLVTMIVLGGALLLAINAGRGAAALSLLAAAGYSVLLMLLDRRWGWPSGDNPVLHLAVNLPVQPLLCGYLYAGFLRAHDLTPQWSGVVGIGAFAFAGLCLEFGRKITRAPRTGERTYVRQLGLATTTVVALTAAALSSLVVLLALRPWVPDTAGYGWGWLAAAPLALPILAAVLFTLRRLPRWPGGLLLLYVLGNLTSYLAIGLGAKGFQ